MDNIIKLDKNIIIQDKKNIYRFKIILLHFNINYKEKLPIKQNQSRNSS